MSEVNTKPYILRRLTDEDMWAVLEILGNVIPDDLAPVFSQLMAKEKSLDEAGSVVVVRLVGAILKNMPKIHDKVYNFLSSVSGIAPAEIRGMEFGTTPNMIWDIIAAEKNVNFFVAVCKYFCMEK